MKINKTAKEAYVAYYVQLLTIPIETNFTRLQKKSSKGKYVELAILAIIRNYLHWPDTSFTLQ